MKRPQAPEVLGVVFSAKGFHVQGSVLSVLCSGFYIAAWRDQNIAYRHTQYAHRPLLYVIRLSIY